VKENLHKKVYVVGFEQSTSVLFKKKKTFQKTIQLINPILNNIDTTNAIRRIATRCASTQRLFRRYHNIHVIRNTRQPSSSHMIELIQDRSARGRQHSTAALPPRMQSTPAHGAAPAAVRRGRAASAAPSTSSSNTSGSNTSGSSSTSGKAALSPYQKAALVVSVVVSSLSCCVPQSLSFYSYCPRPFRLNYLAWILAMQLLVNVLLRQQ